jgi:hypothetical protein
MTSTNRFIPAVEFAHNMFGFLKPYMKEAIYAFLECPNNDSWNEIYGMVINKGKISTVWQAVLAVDSTFPDKLTKVAFEDEDVVMWPQIPSRELVLDALRNLMVIRVNSRIYSN